MSESGTAVFQRLWARNLQCICAGRARITPEVCPETLGWRSNAWPFADGSIFSLPHGGCRLTPSRPLRAKIMNLPCTMPRTSALNWWQIPMCSIMKWSAWSLCNCFDLSGYRCRNTPPSQKCAWGITVVAERARRQIFTACRRTLYAQHSNKHGHGLWHSIA